MSPDDDDHAVVISRVDFRALGRYEMVPKRTFVIDTLAGVTKRANAWIWCLKSYKVNDFCAKFQVHPRRDGAWESAEVRGASD